MRRNIKNDKVLRAITIGLATMITVTSSPVTVLATEGTGTEDPETEGTGTQGNEEGTEGTEVETKPAMPIVVDKTQLVSGANAMATAAEDYNDESKNGAVAVDYNNAEQAITDANEAMQAARTFAGVADDVSQKVDALTANDGQVTKAINQEKTLEETVGVEFELDANGKVKLDANGNAIVKDNGLADKVDAANTAIAGAEAAKQVAYDALKAGEKLANKADKKIANAEKKKDIADGTTQTANDASATLPDTKSEVEGKLKDIQTDLDTALTNTDFENKVSDAVTASTTALQQANTSLQTAQSALYEAQSASNEAQNNVSNYDYQQMVDVATRAQKAANSAKSAADEADKAVAQAKSDEAAAQQAVVDAQAALTDAVNQATEVLNGYKAEIDRINGLIDTANVDRKKAKNAMKKANEAIDAALAVMHNADGTVTSANTAAFAYQTALGAIKDANDAIGEVTGLNADLTKAEKTRTKGHGYIKKYANTLKEARATYDEAIKRTGTVTANKEKADAAYDDIKKITDDINGYFATAAIAVDKMLPELRALLATGMTYERLNSAKATAESELTDAGNDLIGKYKEVKKIDSTDKTAADIKSEYTTAVNNQSNLNQALEDREADLAQGENEYSELKSQQSAAFQAAQNAWNNATDKTGLQYEIANITQRYELDENGNLKKDKDGKYVENQEYKDLLEAAEKKTPDDWKFVNVKNKDDIHTTEGATVDELMWWGNAEIKEYDEEGKLVTLYKIQMDPDFNQIAIGEAKVVLSDKDQKPSDYNAGLPFTVKVDKDGKEHLYETTYGSYETERITYNTGEKEKTTVYTKKTKEYAFDKYTKENLGNKPTAAATEAQTRIVKINGVADIGKFLEAKRIKEQADGELTRLNGELEAKRKALYGAGDSRETATKGDTEEGSLAYRAKAAQTDKEDNEAFTSALVDFVTTYNTKAGNMQTALDNIKAADDYEKDYPDDKDIKAVKDAKDRIVAAGTEAKKTRNLLKNEEKTGDLDKLEKDIADPEVNVDAYYKYWGANEKGGVVKQLKDTQKSLTLIKKKLDAIKGALDTANGNLTAKSVDTKITIKGKEFDLTELNNTLLDRVNNYKKYKKKQRQAYNPLSYVEPTLMNFEKLSIDLLDKDLAALINTVGLALDAAEGTLKEVATVREQAEAKAKTIRDLANRAQATANRAYQAVDSWTATSAENNEDSGSSSSSSGSSSSGSSDTYVISGSTPITVIPLGATTPSGVAGVRTGRTVARGGAAENSGVLGVKTENKSDTKKETTDTSSKTDNAGKNDTEGNNLVKVENSLVPLADSPFEENAGMNWMWLAGAGAAAGAGVGAYAYARRKSMIAALQEAKKYKK